MQTRPFFSRLLAVDNLLFVFLHNEFDLGLTDFESTLTSVHVPRTKKMYFTFFVIVLQGQ